MGEFMKYIFAILSLCTIYPMILDAKKDAFTKNDLFVAVSSGNQKTVKKILSHGGIPVNSLNNDRQTALDIAVDCRDLKMARLLMKKGGKVTSISIADDLRDMLKMRGLKFGIGGIFFWPLWLGSYFALSDAFDVKVMLL